MATIENSATRRALIAGLASIPAISIMGQLPAAAANDPDAELLQAWHERQNALAEIERHDSFFSYQGRYNDIFDKAEMRVHKLPAKTPAGVLAKLWVAFSHMGGPVVSPEDRAEADTIRRADLAGVEAFAADMDFDCHALFNAIKSLTSIVGRA